MKPDKNKPYYECPRFDFCSVNHCPLDPEKDHRLDLPGEAKCGLGPTRRHRIGQKYPQVLKHQGLWSREWTGRQKWASLSPDEKNHLRTRLLATIVHRKAPDKTDE